MIPFLIIFGLGVVVYLAYEEGVFAMGVSSSPPSSGSQPSFQSLMDKARYWANYYGIDPFLVFAIIKHESNWNPNAVNSSDPSYGLMQLNAKYFGVVRDSDENLKKGCAFLASLLDKYDRDTAIQMYNSGEQGYLNGVRVPDYLNDVLKWYAYYQSPGSLIG